MSKALFVNIVVYALIFFNMLIAFDWIQFGFGPPVGLGRKFVTAVIATALYSVFMIWLQNKQNRRD